MVSLSPSPPPKRTWTNSGDSYEFDVNSDHGYSDNPENPLMSTSFQAPDRPQSSKKPLYRRVPNTAWASAAICFLLVAASTFLMLAPIRRVELQAVEPKANGLPPDILTFEEEDRPLILYAYYETPNARSNAKFFIKHGLHAEADFIFILNGNNTLKDHIPPSPNIRIIQRENTCFDLGSHAEVLNANDGELLSQYKRFILMNASIRGPFLPTWSRECWSDAWLAKVTESNKLVGMTFNCITPHHLQSMIFATDRTGLKLVLPGISECFSNFRDAVKAETGCTKLVWDGGYNATAMMTAFVSKPDYGRTCTHDDVLFDNHYYGMTLHPYETMFQKANRNNGRDQLKLLTDWHDASGYSSWDACWKAKNVRKAVRAMKKLGYDGDFGL